MAAPHQHAPLQLSDHEQSLLDGAFGAAIQFTMQLVVRAATIMQAPKLLPTNYLHIDACHYYGTAHLDFARFLAKQGTMFEIPAWTNTVPICLIQNEVREQASSKMLREARELADLYIKMGAKSVWTCAPYDLPGAPRFGEHIIVGESNAVSYFNSVIGARTNKYGDFLDVACGLVQRVPFAGLHTDEGRQATLHIDIEHLPLELRQTELFCHVLGHLMGTLAGKDIPIFTGLPGSTNNDSLKALAAAAAAAGGVELFHAVGVTPEAATIETALATKKHVRYHKVNAKELIGVRDSLSTTGPGPINMVALGTPHFSLAEFERVIHVLDNRKIHSDLVFYITTSRYIANIVKEKGWLTTLESSGITILLDTCTYFSPAVKGCRGRVMTNSAKWAYYAPGMLPVEVVFGDLHDCIESAIKGAVVRNAAIWSDNFWGAQ